MDGPREELIRQARRRLESLALDGVDRVPEGLAPAPVSRPRAAGPPQAVEPPKAPAPATAPPPRPSPPPIVATSLFDEPGLVDPPLPVAERAAALAELAAVVSTCVRCPLLAESRIQTVFGEGDPSARLMFIGEAPGQTEDETGRPFVGRSGELLDGMITKGMGLRREDVYIANILKSRPPGNRDPQPEEVRNCLPYLERQIAVVRPSFLCLLGKPSAQSLLETALPLKALRGKWHRYRGIPTIVTYHPAYLLRNPPAKKDAWEDLKMLMAAMGLNPKK